MNVVMTLAVSSHTRESTARATVIAIACTQLTFEIARIQLGLCEVTYIIIENLFLMIKLAKNDTTF